MALMLPLGVWTYLMSLFATAFVAESKGRPGVGWLLLAVVMGPIALLAVGLAEPAWDEDKAQRWRKGERSVQSPAA
ncbi:MAG: hypothetical protein LAO51_04460 [Acidobacteriia bacterium]|nr:hypothetical protein [Terriglobia bacterium]